MKYILFERSLQIALNVIKNNAVLTDQEEIYKNKIKSEIFRNIKSWYNNTDFVDPETLAALALTGPYRRCYYSDVERIKNFFFPPQEIENPNENFHISEYEESYKNYMEEY